MNKAETVIALQVDKNDDSISIVSPGFCRNRSFEPFAFTITDEGLPQIVEGYSIEMTSKKKVFDVLNLIPEDKFQVLKEVFEYKEEFTNGELIKQIQVVLNKKYRGSKGKGESKIKKLITESREEGWLIQDGNRKPYRIGKLSI